MTTPPAPSSSFQEPPVGLKPESASDGIPPPVGIPPLAMPTAAQLMELLGHFVAQSANQPAHEPKTPKMPAKGHSTAPKFDDEPANLESYFTELEYQFDRCRITSTYDRKVQAVHYLDAAPRRVWRGTEAYKNDKRTWEDFKDKIYKLYPGSGSEQRLNLSDILSFVDTNAHAVYPNEKELGAYYRCLLSDTTMMIQSNHMTPREQSLIYLHGLPDLLHQQTTCRYRMKNLDRHPEDLPPITELYEVSAFCVLGGGLTMPVASASIQTNIPIAQTIPTVPSIFSIMAPGLVPAPPVPPIVPVAIPQAPPIIAQPAINQPLPFTPGLRPEEFSTLLANSITEKMSALLASNTSAPHDHPPQGGGTCNFCGQATHYMHTYEVVAQYLNKNRCKHDQQGCFVLMDGSGIRRGFNENLQQAIDCMSPMRVAAMIKLVSPQLAAASYVGTLVMPTEVAMHVAADNDSDNEDTESLYAAQCEEDLDHLTNKELQTLVHTLSGQLKKGGKPVARGACAAPPKKKTIDAPPPAPTVTSVPTPPASTSINSSSNKLAESQIIPSKPAVPQTIMPQLWNTNQKSREKNASGPDFYYQCPIEDKTDMKKVFDQILDVSIPITACELLSLSSDVRKQAKESTTTKKVKAAAFVGVDLVLQFLHSFNACNCHEGLVVAKESHALQSIVPIIDDQTITITDPNDLSHVATMQTHPRGPSRFHAQKR